MPNAVLGDDGRPVFGGTPIDEGGGAEDINMIAHWTFDEGGGTTAADEVGLNNGTLMSGPSWVPGHIGSGALHFDGNTDYVNIPSSPEMQVTGDITFAGFFKLDSNFNPSSSDTMVIMEKFLDTEHDFHIGLAGQDYNRGEVPKGALVFKVENGSTGDEYCYTWTNRTTWTAGRWYHFACSLYSADTAQNTVFIDGVDDTNPVHAVGIGFLDADYNAPMRIGGRTIDYNGMATDIYFQGAIDGVMIFSRVVTEDDFTDGAGGYKVTTEWMDPATRPIAPHMYYDGTPASACGLSADTPGVRGPDDTGGISSADSFSTWFRDRPGMNMAAAHEITLLDDGTGVFEYLDPTFHPIDGRLLGNEGALHNHCFTYAFDARFTYNECAGQFFEFAGADDAWVFIDGKLVMDIGGIVPGTSQYLELDRLGLTDGDTFTLFFFYAQRQSTWADFNIRTNLPLVGRDALVAGGTFD